MATPVLTQFNLVVNNMEEAVAFYRRLGLEVRDAGPEWREWDRHHRTLVMPNGVHIDLDSQAFAQSWDRGWRGGGHGMGVLGFEVGSRDEVDRLYAELIGAGYRGQQPPYDAFWGSRYAVIEDPDRNAVGIMSPRSDEYRSEPPDIVELDRASA